MPGLNDLNQRLGGGGDEREVKAWFSSLRIPFGDAEAYASALSALGFDDVASLVDDSDEADLERAGLKAGHVRRVARALNELKGSLPSSSRFTGEGHVVRCQRCTVVCIDEDGRERALRFDVDGNDGSSRGMLRISLLPPLPPTSPSGRQQCELPAQSRHAEEEKDSGADFVLSRADSIESLALAAAQAHDAGGGADEMVLGGSASLSALVTGGNEPFYQSNGLGSSDPLSWDVATVAAWLMGLDVLGNPAYCYVDAFESAGIDGRSLLGVTSEADAEDLGVLNRQHQLLLLRAVADLRRRRARDLGLSATRDTGLSMTLTGSGIHSDVEGAGDDAADGGYGRESTRVRGGRGGSGGGGGGGGGRSEPEAHEIASSVETDAEIEIHLEDGEDSDGAPNPYSLLRLGSGHLQDIGSDIPSASSAATEGGVGPGLTVLSTEDDLGELFQHPQQQQQPRRMSNAAEAISASAPVGTEQARGATNSQGSWRFAAAAAGRGVASASSPLRMPAGLAPLEDLEGSDSISINEELEGEGSSMHNGTAAATASSMRGNGRTGDVSTWPAVVRRQSWSGSGEASSPVPKARGITKMASASSGLGREAGGPVPVLEECGSFVCLQSSPTSAAAAAPRVRAVGPAAGSGTNRRALRPRQPIPADMSSSASLALAPAARAPTVAPAAVGDREEMHARGRGGSRALNSGSGGEMAAQAWMQPGERPHARRGGGDGAGATKARGAHPHPGRQNAVDAAAGENFADAGASVASKWHDGSDSRNATAATAAAAAAAGGSNQREPGGSARFARRARALSTPLAPYGPEMGLEVETTPKVNPLHYHIHINSSQSGRSRPQPQLQSQGRQDRSAYLQDGGSRQGDPSASVMRPAAASAAATRERDNHNPSAGAGNAASRPFGRQQQHLDAEMEISLKSDDAGDGGGPSQQQQQQQQQPRAAGQSHLRTIQRIRSAPLPANPNGFFSTSQELLQLQERDNGSSESSPAGTRRAPRSAGAASATAAAAAGALPLKGRTIAPAGEASIGVDGGDSRPSSKAGVVTAWGCGGDKRDVGHDGDMLGAVDSSVGSSRGWHSGGLATSVLSVGKQQGLALELSCRDADGGDQNERSYEFSDGGTLRMQGFTIRPNGMTSAPPPPERPSGSRGGRNHNNAAADAGGRNSMAGRGGGKCDGAAAQGEDGCGDAGASDVGGSDSIDSSSEPDIMARSGSTGGTLVSFNGFGGGSGGGSGSDGREAALSSGREGGKGGPSMMQQAPPDGNFAFVGGEREPLATNVPQQQQQQQQQQQRTGSLPSRDETKGGSSSRSGSGGGGRAGSGGGTAARSGTSPRTREATVILEEIGRGAGGTVHKAVHVPSLRLVAVKTVPVHDDSQRHQVAAELRAMHSTSTAPLPLVPTLLPSGPVAATAATKAARAEQGGERSELGANGVDDAGHDGAYGGGDGGLTEKLGAAEAVAPAVAPVDGKQVELQRRAMDVVAAEQRDNYGGESSAAEGEGEDQLQRQRSGWSPLSAATEPTTAAASAAGERAGEDDDSVINNGDDKANGLSSRSVSRGGGGASSVQATSQGGNTSGTGAGAGSNAGLSPSCPYIVAFHDAYTDPERGCVCLVMEYMGGGTLQQLVQRRQPLSEPALAVVARSVLKGLAELHACHRLHRDVKPSNVLIGMDGRVKLSDFGVARELHHATDATASLASTFTGTLTYMSPERITHDAYSYPSDVWSLGLVVATLAKGAFPLALPTKGGGYWAVALAVQEGPPPLDPKLFGPELCDFVDAMLRRDPKLRATARALLKHPFLKKHGRREARRIGAAELAAAVPPVAPQRLVAVAEAVIAHRVAAALEEAAAATTAAASGGGAMPLPAAAAAAAFLRVAAPRRSELRVLASQMGLSSKVVHEAFVAAVARAQDTQDEWAMGRVLTRAGSSSKTPNASSNYASNWAGFGSGGGGGGGGGFTPTPRARKRVSAVEAAAGRTGSSGGGSSGGGSSGRGAPPSGAATSSLASRRPPTSTGLSAAQEDSESEAGRPPSRQLSSAGDCHASTPLAATGSLMSSRQEGRGRRSRGP